MAPAQNNAGFPHNVVFDEDAVPSGVNAEKISQEDYLNAPGEKFTITLKEAGTYEYCTWRQCVIILCTLSTQTASPTRVLAWLARSLSSKRESLRVCSERGLARVACGNSSTSKRVAHQSRLLHIICTARDANDKTTISVVISIVQRTRMTSSTLDANAVVTKCVYTCARAHRACAACFRTPTMVFYTGHPTCRSCPSRARTVYTSYASLALT